MRGTPRDGVPIDAGKVDTLGPGSEHRQKPDDKSILNFGAWYFGIVTAQRLGAHTDRQTN